MVEKEKTINEFTPEQLSGWEEYRQSLYVQKAKSDDLFEKAITFISSGALGLTLTFHDKIVPVENAIWIVLIAVGWFLLVATLFLNLVSHYKSSKSTDYTIDEIDSIIDYQLSYEDFRKKLTKRNKQIDRLNLASIVLLGVGLLVIIMYVSINIHYGKETKLKTTVETTKSTTTQNKQSRAERTVDSTAYLTTK